MAVLTNPEKEPGVPKNTAGLSPEMYEKILDASGEGIHAIDATGRLILYNKAMEKLEGYKAEEVLGKHITKVYNLDWKTSLLLKVLQEGTEIRNYHQNYTTRTGKSVTVVANVIPLFDNGKAAGAVAIVRDHTSFKIMADKVLDLQEELHQRSLAPATGPVRNNPLPPVLLGWNKRFRESVEWAEKAASSDSPVLIYGETGTGKEIIAQKIHYSSSRHQGPFLAINCAAIPENLLEGLLFGTVKGAFTGAVNRVGLLEHAAGGTLYLDEINSMPLALQAKLLRVVEEKKVRPLGAEKESSINVRLISSCNIEPTAAIEKKMLRADLFYRLAVVYLAIPPLRERLDDLELLVGHFIEIYNASLHKKIRGLSAPVSEAFRRYPWPGNVRQLKHTIECAMNIAAPDESYIKQQHIPKYLNLFPQTDPEPDEQEATAEPINIIAEIRNKEKHGIIRALQENGGNITKAAAQLGISRQTLQYRMKKYNLH